jgi:hypothetical protein
MSAEVTLALDIEPTEEGDDEVLTARIWVRNGEFSENGLIDTIFGPETTDVEGTITEFRETAAKLGIEFEMEDDLKQWLVDHRDEDALLEKEADETCEDCGRLFVNGHGPNCPVFVEQHEDLAEKGLLVESEEK